MSDSTAKPFADLCGTVVIQAGGPVVAMPRIRPTAERDAVAELSRGILTFETDHLPPNPTILGAALELTGAALEGAHPGEIIVDAAVADPADPIATWESARGTIALDLPDPLPPVLTLPLDPLAGVLIDPLTGRIPIRFALPEPDGAATKFFVHFAGARLALTVASIDPKAPPKPAQEPNTDPTASPDDLAPAAQ